jgi:hypothetical protein
VLTASEDGTLRLWDVTQVNKDGGAAGGKCQTAVIKPVGSKPGRLAVSACAWSPDGSMIAGGISDGSLQVWSAKSNFASAAVGQVLPPKAQMHLQQHWTYATRPAGTAKGAHAAGEDGVTALRFKRDNVTLASRSTDGTMKLWDIRKLAAPLRVVEGLPTSCPQAGLVFSPDESLIVTSLSDARDGASGALAFFETSTFKLVRRLGVPSGAAAALAWHPRLNQIFVGAGGRAGGGCRILYDPDFSERGALVAVARAPRAKDASDLLPKYEPAYERPTTGGGGRKRQRELVIEKARVAHKPQGPAGTAGAGGRIGGGSGGTLLTQYLLKERGMLFNASNEMDPRESVLRHSSASFLVDTACAWGCATAALACARAMRDASGCGAAADVCACLRPDAQMRRHNRSGYSQSRSPGRRRRRRSLEPSRRRGDASACVRARIARALAAACARGTALQQTSVGHDRFLLKNNVRVLSHSGNRCSRKQRLAWPAPGALRAPLPREWIRAPSASWR